MAWEIFGGSHDIFVGSGVGRGRYVRSHSRSTSTTIFLRPFGLACLVFGFALKSKEPDSSHVGIWHGMVVRESLVEYQRKLLVNAPLYIIVLVLLQVYVTQSARVVIACG